MWPRRPSRSRTSGLSSMLEESRKNGTIPNGTWRRSMTCMFLVLQRNNGEAARDVSEMVFVFI